MAPIARANAEAPSNALTRKVAITKAVAELCLVMLQKTTEGWFSAVTLCVQVGLMQFEHRLRCAASRPTLRPSEDAEGKSASVDEYGDEHSLCSS